VPNGVTKGCARWAVVLLIALAWGCQAPGVRIDRREPITLRIGFGLAAGANAETGINQAARNIALEELMSAPRNGRQLANFAESWSVSPDGLTWRIRLRPAATFHNGHPVTAESVRGTLLAELPDSMGPAFGDVIDIRALGDRELEVPLRRRSTFLMEALADAPIQEGKPGGAGTGPFSVTSERPDEIEMRVHENYFGGRPSIDRLIIKPYASVRSAWADMLRGQVDALYEVGTDALDSLESSNEVNVFTFQRGYQYMLVLNTRKPYLKDPGFRRGLNEAVNRGELISDAFRGHGTPAVGPVWPANWAYSADLPQFTYRPRPQLNAAHQPAISCLIGDPAHERLAVAIQQQLRAVGVDLTLESVASDEALRRARSGDFDVLLADTRQGPNLVRPYLFWHTGGPNNWGHYSNKTVDAALDAIRHAPDDAGYKAGVAAFQRAIIDDPPAVFLAWRERARAVSTRFYVPAEPDTDVLATLHLWRPADGARRASHN
jgi:peptide/nickel transport system substrate-binding protein